MSCSVHDVVALESRGVPTVAIGTHPFVPEAEEQARALGMPDYALLTVAHPIQPLPVERVEGMADGVVAELVRRLTTDTT